MSHPNSPAESFSQQWSASASSLSDSLERNVQHRASLLKSFDDVQGLFPRTQTSSLSAAASQELAALARSLEKPKDFMDLISNEAKPLTDKSIFWGLASECSTRSPTL